MTFAVEEFHDLIRLLEQAPEWRADLRRLLLTEELLSLPEITRELVEAQRRTEERLEALTARVDQLAHAQSRTERVVQELVFHTGRLTDHVGQLRGFELERRYRERAPAYFGRLLRRIHALSSEEVAALAEEAEDRGVIDDTQRVTLLQTDVIVSGLRRTDRVEVYLAVEVSAGIGVHDVDRAVERAQLLAELTGKPAIPVVAGQSITGEAEQRAAELNAWRVLDGRAVAPTVD